MLQKIFAGISIFIFTIAALNSTEIDLRLYEKRNYSQNGEDGVIKAIFTLIGTSSKYYIEFGAKDGDELSNTKRLRLDGWNGVLFDCCYENASINLYNEFITAENINHVFFKYNVPFEFDLLSIDIDGNDFYVWKALDDKFKPSLVVIEYNASHLPNEDKVVIYDPNFKHDGSKYFGASMLALYHLGRYKGYSLVYAEQTGCNLFFIRDDLISTSFKNMNNVKKMYITHSLTSLFYNSKPDTHNRDYVSSLDLLD